MAKENVEIVKDQFAATNERDWKRVMGYYADDVVLHVPPGIRGGTFRGLEALGEWFGDWFRVFKQDAHFDIREINEIGDDGVLVVAAHRASGRASGVGVEATFVWLYRFSGEKIVEMTGFTSPEQAREAVAAPASDPEESPLGRRFAEAFAAKDTAGLTAVLDSQLDFRGLTPSRAWEASNATEFITEVFVRWLEDSDVIDELLSVESGTFADRHRVAYALRGHNDNGPFVVEQQAYFTEKDGRINWLRVLCSGMRPD